MGKTSSASKNKYNAKAYAQVKVALAKDLVELWDENIKADGISKAEFFRSAMIEYLKNKGAM